MEETRRRWPDPEKGPYLLTLRWSREQGRYKLSGLHLDLDDPVGPALTTSILRDLRLAEISVEDRERLAQLPQVKPDAEAVVAGMRPATVKRLMRVTEIYLRAWRAGEPPTKAVQLQMNLTEASAANLVRRARAAGFLPPTTSGVPQG